jgi:hypothetical protein
MTVFPQRCVLTGNGNVKGQEQALDLGFQIPDYGQVYVSARGMAWLARQFGYISQEEAEQNLENVHQELKAAQKRNKELQNALSHVPETIEGVINGIKQLSDSAVTELAGVTSGGSADAGTVDSKN